MARHHIQPPESAGGSLLHSCLVYKCKKMVASSLWGSGTFWGEQRQMVAREAGEGD